MEVSKLGCELVEYINNQRVQFLHQLLMCLIFISL